tara:strand:- start:10233 stop:11330 length:1098 start_codon:yes stop_codon:yes gene_type:complete
MEFICFIIDNLEPAGNIGGYVAISIFGFAISSFYIKQKYQKVTTEIGPKWVHPVVGSLFGSIPGCGATIVVASLYKNQNISFGGLFAAFISTLGEGSFVLLGVSDEAKTVLGNLEVYAIITVFGFLAGTISGYLVDVLKWRTTTIITESTDNVKNWRPFFLEKFIFCSIVIISIFLAPGSIMAFWNAEIKLIEELTKYAMMLFTILSLLYYFLSTFIYKRHNCHCDHDNLKSVISHAILDISMVISYVFIGLVLSNYVIDVIIGVEKFELWMQSSAIFIVVPIAALVGLTPGCGGMIIVATAYLNNIDYFPLAALIAAAIATSGDGIFPLIAQNKKDGLLVSLIGFVVALVVGYIALIMQVSITN